MTIQVSSLKKTFGEKIAVDIPSLVINTGDILGLVGNNGAGKTTLFHLLLDLLEADAGNVSFTINRTEGETEVEPLTVDPSESEDWKQYVGAYINESFLIEFLTPEEYFDFVGQVSGMTKDEIATRLAEFEKFFAGEILDQKKLIRDFSAGNKQKIGIVSALLNRPKMVILDEPFNFLDPSSQNNLKRLLLDYHEQTAATILISSHNLQHTTEVSTRITLMEHGHIIKDLNNTNGNAEQELADYFNIEEPIFSQENPSSSESSGL